jgi:class 3 adenylate cyclase
MFSDLVGSTALSARMDPEDLREVIAAYQKCVAETVRRFGGFVAKYLGWQRNPISIAPRRRKAYCPLAACNVHRAQAIERRGCALAPSWEERDGPRLHTL